jgi:hypothetical protein
MGSTTPQDEHTITEQDVTALSTLDTPAKKQKYVRFDHARAVTLRLREKLTYKQIAQRMNTTEAHVVNSLKKFYAFLEEPGNLYAYRGNKSDLLETMEYRLLVYLSDLMNDKKCASVKDIALALKVVNELGRLERGQSTSNVSVLLKSIEEAHKDPLSRNITQEVEACPEKSSSNGSSTPTASPLESSDPTNSPEPTATLPSNDCTK